MTDTIKNQTTCLKPIRKSIVIRLVLFLLLMCIIVGSMTFRGCRQTIMNDYAVQLKGAIDLVTLRMDADDLQNCVITQTKSEKYEELRTLLDNMVDSLGLVYIYIMIPQNTEGPDSQMYIMESHSEAEYAEGKYRDMFCKFSGDEYPAEASQNFMNAYLSDSISYYDSRSSWGRQYNATMPLFNSSGERFAIICAEINYDVIMNDVIKHTIMSVLFYFVVGLIAIYLLYLWIKSNITDPIRLLEQRAMEFADNCENSKALEYIVFNDPGFKTDNELDSLSMSIKRMAHSLRTYVQDLLKAHEETISAKLEKNKMSKLVYKDPLTKVKNKAAYLEDKISITEDIKQGNAKFAIMMVDINDLKMINDTYGHEHGDEYIVGTCETICENYKHSSVYRIGGDEFIVILQGRDYDNRELLEKELSDRFIDHINDKLKKPWQKYSAATGIADYRVGDSVDDVFARADEVMYRNKEKFKEVHGSVI